MDYPVLFYDEKTQLITIALPTMTGEGKIHLSNPVQGFCLYYHLIDYILSCIGYGWEMGYTDAKEEDEGEEYWGNLLQGRNPLQFFILF